jgi:two-component sensor histidine kinase
MEFKSKSGSRLYLLSGSLVELRGEPCVLISAVDITERKRAEEHTRLLMREMNHRANNLLSIVLGLVQQTGATYGEERTSTRIAERIQGLTASNKLLISGEQRGADMQALVASQLGPFADLALRVSTKGPALRLNAAAAQAIGMALHELATNAVKYGAFSSPIGAIHIEWEVEGEESNQFFRIGWTERDGPPVAAPERSGFGRVVMEEMARHALSCEVKLAFDPKGVVWMLHCPAKEVLER